MDNDSVSIQTFPDENNANAVPWILRIIAALLAVAATAIAVWALKAPPKAVDFTSLSSPEKIKAGEVYLIDDMLSAGIFMYMGDSDQKGTVRKSEKGIYLEKEYVYSYHTLAMADCGDSKCLMIFSVKNDDGEIFDAVAAHDKKENEEGDPGSSFPVSAYVKARRLGSDASDAFTKSKEDHGSAVGMENVSWAYFEMEYLCGAEEDYAEAVTAEKREWLMLSVYAMPVVAVLFALSFIKAKKNNQQN